MRSSRRSFLLGLAGAGLAACSGTEGAKSEESARTLVAKPGVATEAHRIVREATVRFTPRYLVKTLAALLPIHERTTTPKPGEWRYDHPEPGQSFEEYLASSPTLPTSQRRTIVVEPLGELPTASARIVEITAQYLSRHFGLPVRTLPPAELGVVPSWAHRRNFGSEQYLTRWLLGDVLPRHLPRDAMALVAFLDTDLWPGEGWNYVFGEATLADRVGVWSLHRYGDPSESPAAFKLALRRAIKIATHETGHMFSLHHCTAFRCLQAGVNSLDEADASPLWLCPDCLAKIAWATKTDPRTHLSQVRELCEREGLAEEAAFFGLFLELLASS